MAVMTINCDVCGGGFLRSLKHVRQNKRRDSKNCCSEECILKALSKRFAGKKNPNYGKTGFWANQKRLDHSKKMIGKMKGRNNPMHGKPGTMLGKHHSEETKEKMRLVALKMSNETRRRMSESHIGLQIGEKNPNYKDGRTSKDRIERGSPKNKQFIQKILKRDNYICLICEDSKGGKLEVDHIMPWSLYPKMRYDSGNVRTLCKPCHKEYGANPAYSKFSISPIYKGTTKQWPINQPRN